jgi:primosomal protein N'
MLPYDKYYLQHEINEIERSIKHAKLKKKDTVIMVKFICCFSLIFFAAASSDETWIKCPHCDELIEMAVKPGKWSCPDCGYNNDNRIRYCGMCGAERG